MNYLGGYYLLKLGPVNFGSKLDTFAYTSSDCINDNLVNPWAYSWTRGNTKQTKEAKENFRLADESIAAIRTWIDKKVEDNKLGWINVFTEIESAFEYERTFFSYLDDVNLFALYFAENDTAAIIEEFKPRSEKEGEIGIFQILSKHINEKEDENETLVGYDLIGIEDGGDFHSFHCHDLGNELSEKFGLTLNNFGLFDSCNDWKPVLDYLNNDDNVCEPVPWFVAKTKLVRKN